MKSLPEIIDGNKKQTRILVSLFFVLIGVLGLAVGFGFKLYFGESMSMNTTLGIALSFVALSIVYTAISYFSMIKFMAISSGAKKINEADDPILYHIVEDMAIMARVPMPDVYIINDNAPNAFASGRDPEHAMIAVTSGLREILTREELEGVIAHEMAHIKNYDIRLTSLSVAFVAFLVGAGAAMVTISWHVMRVTSTSRNKNTNSVAAIALIILLIGWIIRLVGIPLAKIIQFAISREREYLADATGAEFAQNPSGLISALTKIEHSQVVSPRQQSAVSALYISKPKTKSNKKTFYSRLYNSHPDTNDRITRLKHLK